MIGLRLGVSSAALARAGLIPPWVSPGAVADYDFRNDRYYGPALSVSRASAAYIDDLAGNWTLVPPNTLRRSNKGVLIEGAQTNSIRNNSMQGAVAGSPGTLPTNWSNVVVSGLTHTVVGLTTSLGVDCIDIRVQGTATATATGAIQFDATGGGVSSANGQLLSSSAFVAITSGSISNLSAAGIQLGGQERDASTSLLTAYSVAQISPTNLLQRFSASRTNTQASTAFVVPNIRYNVTSGQVYDFTLRIGWPQLEQWSTSVTTVGGASSPIRTTGTAATRAADVVTATLGSGLTAWTMAGLVVSSPFVVSGAPISELNDGTATNAAVLRQNAAGGNLIGISTKAGAQSGVFAAVASPAAGSRLAVAYAQDGPSASAAISVNGSAPSGGAVATSDQSPTAGLNALRIGSARVVGTNWSGYIERLAVYPYRAANSNLQQMSTLANWGG